MKPYKTIFVESIFPQQVKVFFFKYKSSLNIFIFQKNFIDLFSIEKKELMSTKFYRWTIEIEL